LNNVFISFGVVLS